MSQSATIADVIDTCTTEAFAGTMTFPEVVRRLSAVGVERYYADLQRLVKTASTTDGQSLAESLPLSNASPIADEFSPDGVRDALTAIQRGDIIYPEFLRRIMSAGVVGYHVFLGGRRAMYLGRHGDLHIEEFGAKT